MGIYAYGETETNLDKTKSWVNVSYKQIFTREIKYRKYTAINKRYNSETSEYDYFIVMTDTTYPGKISKSTYVDNYGRIKIRVDHIWKECNLKYYTKDTNIDITNVESGNDYDVYRVIF